MANLASPIPRRNIVQKAAVLSALASVGVDSGCPRCRANAWGGVGPEGDELSVKLLVVDADSDTRSADNLPPGVRCAALICNHCGFVSLHSERVVRQAM
jgi:hypothetical protein